MFLGNEAVNDVPIVPIHCASSRFLNNTEMGRDGSCVGAWGKRLIGRGCIGGMCNTMVCKLESFGGLMMFLGSWELMVEYTLPLLDGLYFCIC